MHHVLLLQHIAASDRARPTPAACGLSPHGSSAMHASSISSPPLPLLVQQDQY